MAQAKLNSARSERRNDLDWLRVLAVLLLVPYHSALVFDPNPHSIVYLKDTVRSPALIEMVGFIHRWHMPLLFAIAGSASWYALRRRSSRQYLGERTARLLLPFGFGVLTLVPLMVNVRWLGRPGAPSLAQLYMRFFTADPGDLNGLTGAFTPAHLWFIFFLFGFSLLGLPLLQFLRRPGTRRALAAVAAWPGSIYLFAVPLTLAAAVDIPGAMNPLYYFLTFLFGYILAADACFQSAIDRLLPLSAIMAIVATAVSMPLLRANPPEWSGTWLVGNILYEFSCWIWVLAILGAGHRWFKRGGPVLRYANEAAFPFYILHEPVNTLVAFFVVRLGTGVAAKYALIVVVTTLVTLAIYELTVRRVSVLRVCFGMRRPRPVLQAAPGARRNAT